jgi:hypothetical protein
MISSKSIFTSIVLFLAVNTANAQITETVLVRNKHFKPVFKQEVLENLLSSSSFDGLYFKIVKGKSDEAISLSEKDEALKLKAATTYYHLNLARKFWAEEMKSEYVKAMPKVTIRLEITNRFSELGHFQHESIEPQHNNALSIPAGEPMEGVEIPAWGNEIWFRPIKKILSKDLPASGLDAEGNPLTKYLSMLSKPIQSTYVNRFIQVTFQNWFYPQSLQTPYQELVMRQFATILGIQLLLEGSKHANRLFLEKYYYLDTAMIPEIIYHEFSHVALSDHLALSLSTPMLEGMADYFATSISGSPHIASKIRKYSLSQPKDAKNKSPYNQIFESNLFANSDFVLSVLWLIKKEFPEQADALIYDARTRLKTETSDIRHDLIGSIMESCWRYCQDPRRDRMRIREILEDKGF